MDFVIELLLMILQAMARAPSLHAVKIAALKGSPGVMFVTPGRRRVGPRRVSDPGLASIQLQLKNQVQPSL
jgi:hypothetical protein